MTNTAPPALLEAPYQQRSFIAQALDPIHIGTGEFRLGRVDNTIVREPGTNLPKIPGSSIAGVARAYAAMKTDQYRRVVDGKSKSCAGRGGDGGNDHCGTCDVCIAFGFSKANGGSFQGLAQFSDARLLFFPVYSLLGPLWITCPSALQNAGYSEPGNLTWAQWNTALDKNVFTDKAGTLDQINLGWLYLPVLRDPQPPLLAQWAATQTALPADLKPVFDRLALVSDAVFSIIVDDQLEVRTSVSISPETGAAEPGALFTAEALPRASVLLFQVTVLNPRNFRLPNGNGGAPIPTNMAGIHGTVAAGLDLIEFLGVGGVNTRGMGRLKVFPGVAL